MSGARILPVTGDFGVVESSREASIFQSSAWFQSLIATAAGKTSWRRFDVGDGAGRLSALLGEPARTSATALRQLWFNESGDAALDRVYPEYNDFLGATQNNAARSAALSLLFESFPQTEEFYFRNCRPELTEAIRTAATGFGLEAFQTQATWRIDLASLRAQGSTVVDALSGSARRRLRQATSFYDRRGPMIIRLATAENRASVWRVMSDLHQSSWAARGVEGVFSNAAFNAFHETLVATAPESVHLMTLICDGAPIGVLYNLAFGRTIYNYQSGFTRESDNKARPGVVSHILAADYYAAEGFDTYDLLGGGDHYKSSLAAEGETLTSLVVTRPTLKVRSRDALKKIVGGLRAAAGKRQT